VTGYRIYRGDRSGGETLLVTVGNVLSFTDTSVANGSTYWYQVSAVSADGEGPRSVEAVAERGTAPSAPTGLTATAAKAKVTLSWAAPTSNGGSPLSGHRIYRGTASGAETFLVAVGPGTTSYTDAAVSRRTRYYYVVTAVNALGEGPASAEVSAVPR
jgi:fibronectin type 3 domain-containing protein